MRGLLLLVAEVINRTHLDVASVGRRLNRTRLVCCTCSSRGCAQSGNDNASYEGYLRQKRNWEGLRTGRCDDNEERGKGSSRARKEEVMSPL